MDAATSIAAQTNTTVSEQNATTRGFNDISSEDFFGMMIEELKSQDPLNPKDNQQLLQQMSNIRQMEQSATLTKTLQNLSDEQRFGTTAGLIGNYVLGTVKDSAGVPTDVDGLVVGVTYEGDGNAILNLHDGSKLPANAVREVTLVENLPPDILDQLQSELGQVANGGDLAGGPATDGTATDGGTTGGTGDGGSPVDPAIAATARAIFGDKGATSKSSVPSREAAAMLLNRIKSARSAVHQNPLEKAISDGANIVGELLDGIFSPGIGIRTGA